MTFKIYKDPNKMSLEELFQTQQKMQQEGKKQGQHYPMYTKRKAANGEQPSVDNMHEEATRDQLSHMYKQQNGTEKTKERASDDRVAQNSYKGATDTLGEWRDVIKDGASLLHERDKGIIKTYNDAGQLPRDFNNAIDRGVYGTVGDKQILKDEYKKEYKKKWGQKE